MIGVRLWVRGSSRKQAWDKPRHAPRVFRVMEKLGEQQPLFESCLGVEKRDLHHRQRERRSAAPQQRPAQAESDYAGIKRVAHVLVDAGRDELRAVPRLWKGRAID